MKSKETTMLLAILVLAPLLMLAPYGLKYFQGNTSFSGGDTYNSLRMIQLYKENGLTGVDPLQQRAISMDITYPLLSLIHANSETIAIIIPILIGILTAYIFYLLLKDLKIEGQELLFGILIIIVSPLYIYSFTNLSTEIISTPLLALTVLLLRKNSYFSAIPIIILAFADLKILILGVLAIIAICAGDKSKRKLGIITLASGIIAATASILLFKQNFALEFATATPTLNNIFVELGAQQGYSLIVFALASIGFVIFWNRKRVTLTAILVILAAFAASAFYPKLRLPVLFILALLAGVAVNSIAKREWHNPSMKDFTLILILCSIIFSTVVFLKAQSTYLPEDKIEAIRYLSATNPDDTILSSERNGYLIEYYANRRAYLDPQSYKHPDYKERLETSNLIYSSRSLADAEKLMKENGITHIFVDEQMLSGEVWTSRQEGLLFLLENSMEFVKIFENEQGKIYKYVGDSLQ